MKQSPADHKILIVDDEESYRQVITMTLQIRGYQTVEATNGLDGLAAAKMHRPDLILCDVNMPKMDGHELLEALKQEQEFAGIPFIFLTGNAGPGDLRKGMQLGADDYLTKPFTADELLKAVETRLTKKKTLLKFVESQFDEIKSNIVLSLPHEFRTPLNGILGFSQILIDEEHLSEHEVKQIGGMINKSGIRLHHLLENMVLFGQLQLWRNDQNKVQELRSADSNSVRDCIVSASELQMKKHERAGAVHCSVPDASVKMSGKYLTKIIDELLDNALKFSDAGTTVHVTCERKGPAVFIRVRDEGRGMTEDQLGKISGFQQFERGYYEQQGAGLGLTISKMLTEIHGGTLTIESKKNSGSSVTIMLPSHE